MFFNLLMAKAKKKAEYTELAYLEFDGNQWLDTGIIGNQDTEIQAKFLPAINTAYRVYGSYATDKNITAYESPNGGNHRFGNRTIILVSDSNVVTIVQNKNGITYKGKSYNYDTVNDFETASTLYVGDINGFTGGYRFSGKLYYFRILQNDKLIMDLIPVLDKNLVPSMYDKVSGKYFYNQGDGEFGWRLPNQLACIENTSTQWIDTEYNGVSTVELKAQGTATSGASQVVIGVTSGGGNFFSGYASTNKWGVGSGAGLSDLDYTELGVFKIHFDSNRNSFEYNGNTYYRSGTLNQERNYYLFRCYGLSGTHYYARAKIYYCKMWDSNGKLARYFIPVIDENNEVCMYDLVKKKYHYNQGSGNFTGHAEDGSKVVSYLESTGTQYIDLNYIPTAETGSKIKVSVTGGGDMVICGSRNDSGSTRIYFASTITSSSGYHITYGRNIYVYLEAIIPANTIYEQFVNYKNSNIVRVISDGEDLVNTTLFELTFTPTQSLCLFANNSGGTIGTKFRGKVYSLTLTEGDKVVMNLLPVLDNSSVPCMYDTYSGTYFYDESGNGFNYG